MTPRRANSPTRPTCSTSRQIGAIRACCRGLRSARADLRFALVEAGGGLVASLIDRAQVLCYGLDPAHGVYNSAIRATLIGAGAATLAAVSAITAIAQRRRRLLAGGPR
jgi:protein SCO1/2